jgi:hypothetical protein
MDTMASDSNAVTGGGELEPLSVTIQEAQRLTGESRSTIYTRLARGEYEGVKSDARTLILYESIKDRLRNLPRAKIKLPPPRKRKARVHRVRPRTRKR